jgi:hypothetical protein
MKKWVGVAAILICCGIYAMVRLSISQYQDANPQEKETPGAKQTDVDNTDKATPEEASGTPATAEQVEAITKAFSEFQAAVESQDYEQAWKLMSKSFKSQGSFEEFKEGLPDARDEILKSTIRPESATSIGGRVRLLIVDPSGREEQISFIQEDGQWKFAP